MNVPVFCSLIPAEFAIACGLKPDWLDAGRLSRARPSAYHCAFHENICSYPKVIYDYLLQNRTECGFVIVPSSCDAMKKLYNALCAVFPREKLHLLDVPKLAGDGAAGYFAAELGKLRKRIGGEFLIPPSPFSPLAEKGGEGDNGCPPRIGVMGANVPLMLYEECAARFGFEIVHVNHCITKSHPREEGFDALRTGTEEYAAYFLRNIRCPRMCGEGYRKAIREEMKEKGITALIFNVLKFCDFQPFDHKCFSEEPDVPVLAIEHELTANYEGQIMTRIEAFFEHLRGRNGGRGRKTGGRYFVGIDSGSHATKLVCIDSERRVVARDVVPTGTSVRGCAEELVSRLRNVHGIAAGGIARTIATGYGRNEIKIADDAVTEITCHALGAHHILGREATIIDIGGQDSKAIKISKDGAVVRFAMNDKCAAGTGRFLEVMAAKLGMEIGGFAELALRASEHVPISSMCSVFAESEVISLIASGRTREEIAKGIHMAIAERTAALARRIGGAAPYYMAGGVARNKALVAGISACLGDPVSVIVHPQFSGALGAAIIAGGG